MNTYLYFRLRKPTNHVIKNRLIANIQRAQPKPKEELMRN